MMILMMIVIIIIITNTYANANGGNVDNNDTCFS